MNRYRRLAVKDVDRIAEEIWHRVRAVNFETAAKMAERIVQTLNNVRGQT